MLAEGYKRTKGGRERRLCGGGGDGGRWGGGGVHVKAERFTKVAR